MNRSDLSKQMQEAATVLVEEKGYISFVVVRGSREDEIAIVGPVCK